MLMRALLITLISLNLYAGIIIPPLEDVIQRNNQSVENLLYPKKDYSLLVWNIYKQAKDDFYRDEMFIRGFDFSLLQEISQDNTFELFIKGFISDYIFAASFLDDGIGTGVGVISRVKINEYDFVRSYAREPVIKTPKMAAIADIKIFQSNKSLKMISIHAVNFVRLWAFKKHIDQVFAKVKDHKGPMIWAGDFNTWNKSRLNYLIYKLKQLKLTHLSLKDSHLVKKFMGKPLDHIFVRGISVKSARAIAKPDQSDHNPLVLKFSL